MDVAKHTAKIKRKAITILKPNFHRGLSVVGWFLEAKLSYMTKITNTGCACRSILFSIFMFRTLGCLKFMKEVEWKALTLSSWKCTHLYLHEASKMKNKAIKSSFMEVFPLTPSHYLHPNQELYSDAMSLLMGDTVAQWLARRIADREMSGSNPAVIPRHSG